MPWQERPGNREPKGKERGNHSKLSGKRTTRAGSLERSPLRNTEGFSSWRYERYLRYKDREQDNRILASLFFKRISNLNSDNKVDEGFLIKSKGDSND
jgi:hypothetical protein